MNDFRIPECVNKNGWKEGEAMDTRKDALISIIVPVYQVEKYIKCCVDSVLKQSYQNWELILVDDGSKDQSGIICDAYAKKDARIHVIHKENGGLSDARNAGLAQAKGSYIFLLDSDDFLHQDTLYEMYQAIISTKSDLAICNIQYVDETGQPIYGQDSCREYCVKKDIWNQERFWDAYTKNGKIVCVVAWNKLYKKELFKDLYYPKGKVREDEFLIHRVIDRCQRICCVDKKLCYYRQRSESTMGQSYKKNQMDAVEAYLDRAAFFQERKQENNAEKALLDAIAFLAWYDVGMDKTDSDTCRRYQKLKKETCLATKQQAKRRASLIFKVVTGLYRRNLFPYKFIRNLWWKLDHLKQKLRRTS